MWPLHIEANILINFLQNIHHKVNCFDLEFYKCVSHQMLSSSLSIRMVSCGVLTLCP